MSSEADKSESEQSESNSPSPKGKRPMKTYAILSSMAIQMAVCIGAGVWFGDWLDEKYSNKTPIWTIVLSLLGISIAFYFVIRDAKKLNRDD